MERGYQWREAIREKAREAIREQAREAMRELGHPLQQRYSSPLGTHDYHPQPLYARSLTHSSASLPSSQHCRPLAPTSHSSLPKSPIMKVLGHSRSLDW